jgi:outer membrane protein assembly factor BamA
VNATVESVSATSSAITFNINEGDRVRVGEIHFESKVFKSGTLRSQMKLVRESGLFSRFKEQDICTARN